MGSTLTPNGEDTYTRTDIESWPATVKLRDYRRLLPTGKATVKGGASTMPASTLRVDERSRMKSSLRDPTGPAHLAWNLCGLVVLMAVLGCVRGRSRRERGSALVTGLRHRQAQGSGPPLGAGPAHLH